MTPLEHFDNIYLKREDQNPTGSAKDRALPAQIKNLLTSGYHSAVISSSGNAAISAQYFCQQSNINLTIFVSPSTIPAKLQLLKNYHISSQPISDAFKFAKQNHSYFLRQSTDPSAIVGYSEIGKEIILQCPQVTSLFVPVGSGTTLYGVSTTLPRSVKIFAVQPASHCPIASHFDKNYVTESNTITDALSVKLLPLKQKIISACFSGVVVQNSNVKDLINTSPEGNLAYAGYLKVKESQPVGSFPVILLTGSKR